MKYDQEIDARSLLCPLPVLKARKRLKNMDPGQVLKLTADDPAAVIDVPHFCNEQDYTLADVVVSGPVRHYFIKIPL
jgi:tRNA 2-thiouridine synthesizing protein A